MKNVILAGNSTTGIILNAYLKGDSRYKIIAAAIDDEFVDCFGIDGVASIGLSRLSKTISPSDSVVIMAMGYSDLNRGRESMFYRLKALGYSIETYIHPDAKIYSEYSIGEGSIILPGSIIEPYVRVGANTFVWCNVTLAHHSYIAENCWIASGSVISGQANIARNTFVGVNATVVNKISVGEFNIIGGGSFITKDTKPNSVHLTRSAEKWRYTAEDYEKYFGI